MKLLLLLAAILPFNAYADFVIDVPPAAPSPKVPTYLFTEAETQALLRKQPGDLVVLPGPDGKVVVAEYLGPKPGYSKHFVFKPREVISEEELLKRQAGNAPRSAQPPTAAPGAPASDPRKGRSQAPNGISSPIGSALNAGLQGALSTGLIRGLIIPPRTERELKQLEADMVRAEAAAMQEFTRLSAEVSAYESLLAEEASRMGEKLKAPEQPGFFRSSPPQGSASDFSRSEAGQVVASVRSDLLDFSPPTPEQASLKEVALGTADASEAAFAEGKPEEARGFAGMARKFADAALGIDPYTGLVRDGYEFLTGKNLVTGAELSGVERTVAGAGLALGLATFGVGSSVVNGLEQASKLLLRKSPTAVRIAQDLKSLYSYGREIGATSAAAWKEFVDFSKSTLRSEIGAIGNVGELIQRQKLHLGAWAEAFEIRRIQTAEMANAAYLRRFPTHKPPFRTGTLVVEGVLKEDAVFVRLHREGSAEGYWLVRGEAIDKTLTGAELRLKYSLPFTPEFATEAYVKKGTLIQRSKVASNFGGAENAIQYQILDPLHFNGVKFAKESRKLP